MVKRFKIVLHLERPLPIRAVSENLARYIRGEIHSAVQPGRSFVFKLSLSLYGQA